MENPKEFSNPTTHNGTIETHFLLFPPKFRSQPIVCTPVTPNVTTLTILKFAGKSYPYVS